MIPVMFYLEYFSLLLHHRRLETQTNTDYSILLMRQSRCAPPTSFLPSSYQCIRSPDSGIGDEKERRGWNRGGGAVWAITSK